MTTHQLDPSHTLNARTSNVAVATSAPFSNSTRILLSSSGGSNSAGTYQKKLALRLRELQLEKQALRTAHNATTQICSLPDDVLSLIFLDLASMEAEPRVIRHCFAKKQSWVPQTNICRRWREVAIGCASLWTSPLFHWKMPEWGPIMVDRSQQAPLTLKLIQNPLGSTPDPTSSKALSAISGRLRVVEIQSRNFASAKLSVLLSHCQWSTAPMLENLTIDNLSEGSNRASGADTFPDNFLLGGTPSLRKLEVLCCFVEWSKLPVYNVPQMTHLSLANGKGAEDQYRPSVKALADALRAMPLLESLKLVEFIPSGEEPAYPARTTLLTVTSLTVMDSGKRIKHFFDTIDIPDYAYIDVHDRTDARPEEIEAQFLSILASLKPGPLSDTKPSLLDGIQKLDVTFGGDGLKHKLWTFKMWPVADDDASKPETFKFTYQDSAWFPERVDSIRVLQLFDLDPLEILNLTGGEQVRTDAWRRVFAPLPNLKEITLGKGTHFGRFARAMRLGQYEPATESGEPTKGAQAFPSLSKLNFSEVDLNMKRSLKKKKAINPFIKFCDVMKERSQTSAPIIELSMRKCKNIVEADKRALEAAGASRLRVQWDKREDVTSESETLRWYSDVLAESSDDAGLQI
ncbi:hypothetical protein D9611_013860 [Ephemerocybe angulata]|uniref:F-box domain-containing protein n=1 Tax=Ephemerocybe angulata TaxID=980116 RepID=A0A8H5BTL8_9AGAR|nr:hypothetical protein D9611_013860 [Tulosesus angulatus]